MINAMPDPRYFLSCVVLAMLSMLPPTVASGQQVRIRTVSVLLKQDVDGDGREDYVVREARTGKLPGTEYRVAIYLNAAPETRAPRWSTPWTDDVIDFALSRSEALTPEAWLLKLDGGVGDESFTSLFVITRGRVREDVTFTADYSDGFMDVRDEKGRHIVEASLKGLRLRGKPVAARIACHPPSQKAMRLRFEPAQQQFVQDQAFCAPSRQAAPPD